MIDSLLILSMVKRIASYIFNISQYEFFAFEIIFCNLDVRSIKSLLLNFVNFSTTKINKSFSDIYFTIKNISGVI